MTTSSSDAPRAQGDARDEQGSLGTVTIEVPVQVTVPDDRQAIPRVMQVLHERLDHDEDYGFEYGITFG